MRMSIEQSYDFYEREYKTVDWSDFATFIRHRDAQYSSLKDVNKQLAAFKLKLAARKRAAKKKTAEKKPTKQQSQDRSVLSIVQHAENDGRPAQFTETCIDYPWATSLVRRGVLKVVKTEKNIKVNGRFLKSIFVSRV